MAVLHEEKTLSGIDIAIEYANDHDTRVTDEELNAYIARERTMNPEKNLCWMKVEIDGEEAGIHYGYRSVPFERIRRITGYLVGTLDRFNDAKRSEESERVKHSVPSSSCSCSH